MNEQLWMTSTDLRRMLSIRRTDCCGCLWVDNGDGTVSLCGGQRPCGQCDNGPILPYTPFSDRKLRLWVEACRAMHEARDTGPWPFLVALDDPNGLRRAVQTWSVRTPITGRLPLTERTDLLRDIIGNPFRPFIARITQPDRYICDGCGTVRYIPPYESGFSECDCGVWHWLQTTEIDEWRTPQILSLAEAAYSGDQSALGPLSDALEEAGCDDEAILTHLRLPGVHVNGCWVIDFVLKKE